MRTIKSSVKGRGHAQHGRPPTWRANGAGRALTPAAKRSPAEDYKRQQTGCIDPADTVRNMLQINQTYCLLHRADEQNTRKGIRYCVVIKNTQAHPKHVLAFQRLFASNGSNPQFAACNGFAVLHCVSPYGALLQSRWLVRAIRRRLRKHERGHVWQKRIWQDLQTRKRLKEIR